MIPPAEPEDPSSVPEIAVIPLAEPEVPAAAVAEATPAPDAEPMAAAAASPPPDGFQVQLGAYRVAENAPAEWRRLQRAEADLLGGLEPRVRRLDLGDQVVLHLLQVGPLADSEAAGALCRALAKRGVDCLVIAP